LATTLGISQDALGNYIFSKTGTKNAYILNYGNIKANRPGGYVALLSQAVNNHGVIVADLSTIILASGEKMVLNLDNKGAIGVVIEEGVKEAVFGPEFDEDGNPIRGEDGKVKNTKKFKNLVNPSIEVIIF